MKFYYLFITVMVVNIISCDKNKTRRIIVGDTIAEGKITKDTIYSGQIKFYDTATNQLVMSANYKDGLLDGERIDYYPNGKQKMKLNYEKGKTIGELIFFDSLGNVSGKQFSYYDLGVGPAIEYKENNISQYYFRSLEGKELLHINYDSIRGKRTEQLNDTSFFFWNLNNYTTSESITPRTNLLLYLPNPPKLNFQYALCIINSKYEVKRTIKEFTSDKSWDEIDIDFGALSLDEYYAIQLTVDNEFDKTDEIAVMFKRL